MSKIIRIPINPEIISWARSRFNIDREYAAKRLKISCKKLQEYENGSENPTYSQLEDMAKLFHIPLEVFFYPEPPKLEKPDVKHRTHYSEYLQDTPTEILLMMNKAEIMQNNLRDLCSGKNPSEHLITKNDFENDPQLTAEQVRAILGVNIEKQPAFHDRYQALNFWREQLADAGIFIFKENFKNDGYSGFCLNDAEFPVIYLNSSMPLQRQIFTIFHELYHLIKNRNGMDICNKETAEKYLSPSVMTIEKECGIFAEEFLVPKNHLIETVNRNDKISRTLIHGTYSEIQNICIKPLAEKYAVGNSIMLVRLIQTGYVKEADYDKLILPDAKKKGTGDKKSKPSFYTTKASQLGKPYIKLVSEKQTEYGLEDYQAAEYLGISARNLDGLIAEL